MELLEESVVRYMIRKGYTHKDYLIITGTFTQTEEASAQEMFAVSVRSEELPEFLTMKLLLLWDVSFLFMAKGMEDC